MVAFPRKQPKAPDVVEKKLYKDIWANHILPELDVNDLLQLSAVSKQARQAAFAELFKRPSFKTKIDEVIHSENYFANRSFFNRENSFFGEKPFHIVLRASQLFFLLLIVQVLEVAYHTHAYGYPTAEQLDEVLRLWRASPRYGSEFDSPPIAIFMTYFPDDGYRSLTLTLLILVIASFVARDLFIRTNRSAIQAFRQERDDRAAHKFKSSRLTYLRDQLPRESIVTHSLFAQFEDSVKGAGNSLLRPRLGWLNPF